MFISLCNYLVLGEVARPESFELPAFWFVGRKSSKCRYWYRLRAKRATCSALNLDGSWTEPKIGCGRRKRHNPFMTERGTAAGITILFEHETRMRPIAGELAGEHD
jgi:hypothetical protein